MIQDAFHEAGLPIADYNQEDQMTVMNAQAIAKAGVRWSTNNAFIQPIRYKRKNLTVRVECEVFKVLINRRKVAYGVKYRRNGTVCTAYARKEVIISAGPIESPKLLMLSGVGPKDHLTELNIPVVQDLAVGENLQDHVTFNGFLINVNRSSTWPGGDKVLEEIREYDQMEEKNGPLAGNGINNVLAFIKTDPSLEAPDIQYHIGSILIDDFVKEPGTYQNVYDLPTSYYTGLLARAMNLIPKSRGKLLLNSTNPEGHPLLYVNYLADPSDLEPVMKGYKFLLSLEKTEAFKSRGAYVDRTPLVPCEKYAWGTDEYWNCLAYAYTSSTYHHAGSCKMGPRSDRKAVVDNKLRVYGISKLRVIDSSIMPFVVRGNTNIPSIMIGERGVAFVLQYWKKRKCIYC